MCTQTAAFSLKRILPPWFTCLVTGLQAQALDGERRGILYYFKARMNALLSYFNIPRYMHLQMGEIAYQ